MGLFGKLFGKKKKEEKKVESTQNATPKTDVPPECVTAPSTAKTAPATAKTVPATAKTVPATAKAPEKSMENQAEATASKASDNSQTTVKAKASAAKAATRDTSAAPAEGTAQEKKESLASRADQIVKKVEKPMPKSAPAPVEKKKAEEAPAPAPAPAAQNRKKARFEIKKTKDGRFVFNLYASNNVIVATSQIYSSSASAVNGIHSIIANAQRAAVEDQTLKNYEKVGYPKWEIYMDNGGQYRFRLDAPNGSCIVHSQGYTTKANCKNGIESIIKNAKDAIVDKSYLKKDDD